MSGADSWARMATWNFASSYATGPPISAFAQPCRVAKCPRSTEFSMTSWTLPASSQAAVRAGLWPISCHCGTDQSGSRPSWCRQTKTPPFTSWTGSCVSGDRGGGVPYPVRTHVPSGPNEKKWKGHVRSSPSTFARPRWAPRCGQYGRTARSAPVPVRYSTTSRPASGRVSTVPGRSSCEKARADQPLG